MGDPLDTGAEGPSPGERSRRPQRRRRFVGCLIVLAALVAVVPLGLLVAQRSEWVHRSIVAAADRAMRDSLQVGLDVERLTIRDLGRSITIEGLAIGASTDRPLVRVDRVEARLRLRTLPTDRPTVESLSVEGVHVDLGADLPTLPASETGAAADDAPGIHPVIETLAVRDLTVVSGTVAESLDVWLDGWRLSGIAIDGVLDGDAVEIERLRGDLQIDSHHRAPIDATFAATLAGELGGPFALSALALEADGLTLTGNASGTLDATLPFDAALVARVDAGRLFPDLTADGRLDAEIALTHAASAWSAAVALQAHHFPAELLDPLRAKSGLEQLQLAGSWIEARTDLRGALATDVDPWQLTLLDGTADVGWRNDDERLLAARARADSSTAASLEVAVELLPDAPGNRTADAELHAPDWSWPADDAQITARGRFEVAGLDDARWYVGLDRGLDWRPAGDLLATATLDGPLAHPSVDAGLRWDVAGDTVVEGTARTIVGSAPFTVRLDAELLPAAPGQRALGASWTASTALDAADLATAALEDARIELAAPDVAQLAARATGLVDQLLPQQLAARWRGWIDAVEPGLRGSLDVEGAAAGPLRSVRFDLATTWQPAPGERVRIAASGVTAAGAPYGLGDTALEVDVTDLSLAPFAAAARGTAADAGVVEGIVAGSARLEGLPSALVGTLRFDARDLQIGSARLSTARLEARSDGDLLELTRFGATLDEPIAIPGVATSALPPDEPGTPARIEGRGAVRLARPLAQAELTFEAENLATGISSAAATARVADGVLRIETTEVRYAGDEAQLAASLPLGAFGDLPEPFAALVLTAPGPVELSFGSLEVAPLLSLFGVPSAFDARIDGTLSADPHDLVAARGELRVGGLRFDLGTEGGDAERFATQRDVVLSIADGSLTLDPTELVVTSSARSGEAACSAAAELRLDTTWQPGDDPAALLGEVAARLSGTVDAALFNPFVPGIRAAGRIALDVDVSGHLPNVDATVALSGPEARLLYSGKYALTLEDPDIRLSLENGRPRLDHARGRLNGGRLEATGRFTDGDALLVRADVDDARLRLDLGVTAQVDADLELRWPPTGMRTLAGRVVVDRGVLRRDVNLEREALRILFEPSSGANLRELELVALDLAIETSEGVFIKNNLADLQADWSGLRVTGTLASPLLAGQVDVAPGGWLNAFGTVYRIDELSLAWADEPPSSVRIVMETTSSFDDPSLLQQYRGVAFTSVGQRGPGEGGQLDFRGQGGVENREAVTAALVNYYQDKLAGAASGGRTEFSFEPVPLFGETDTQARYTLWQHFNPYTALIWSVDPRQAEGQTWILDLHGFPFAPRWRVQLFTRDASFAQGEAANNLGATIQQTLELGGGAPPDDPNPRLRKIAVKTEGGPSKRRIRAASGYRKGDRFAGGAVLDVEVDVIDLLRRRGFPGGDVDVRLTPLEPGRAVLEIEVVGGVRVDFLFEGERLSRGTRREIRSLYRPLERDERLALGDMRAETVRRLRAGGFLAPEVEVEALPADPAVPDDRKTVRVAMRGGRRIEPGPPVVRGLPEDDARTIAAQFGSTLERIELAAGVADADAYLRQSMRAIGYPDARVLDRELSADGSQLTVDVAPGPRQRIVAIGFDGVATDDAERLASLLLVGEGDPPRFGLIGASARAMEDDLASRGHAEARVRALVTPEDPAQPLDVLLRLEVSPGPVFRIAGVRYDGLVGSKPSWVEKRAGLEPGTLLRRDAIAEARRRLYRTGVFRRIQVEGDRPAVEDAEPPQLAAACGPLCPAAPDATAEGAATARDTEIVFDLQENRRYQLSYGLRWESDTGLGLVVDFIDRNSLGRGHTSGVRAIYGSDLKSLRFYHQIPRVLRQRSSLEFFLEGRDERVDGETSAESIQLWSQLTTPLGKRTQTRVYAVLEDRDLVSGSRQQLDERVVSPRLGWQWVYTTVDRALGRERQGWFVGLDISGAHEELGSDVTTLSSFQQFKYFWHFKKRKLNWAQSWRFGVVDSRGESIPSADRLRVGGSYSVRGYPTNSLGPLGPDGFPLGGEVQFIVNQELHRAIWGPVGAVVFFDVGNVWESVDTLDSELFTSVGLGVRYRSPVGPLRLDVAWPLDRRPDDPTYQVYFGFGQVF